MAGFLGSSLTLNIRAMPCTNFCKHCWAQGSPHKSRMPLDRVLFVLEKLQERKRRSIFRSSRSSSRRCSSTIS